MQAYSLVSGWYYHKHGSLPGHRVGPLSWEQLYASVRNGTVGPNDLVWNQGLSGWFPAQQVPGLFADTPGSVTTMEGAVVPPTYVPVDVRPARSNNILWAWLLPVIALVVVGAGLGAYFGFLRDGDSVSTSAYAPPGSVTVTAADGASVTFPAFVGVPGPEASLTRVADPSGEEVDGSVVVSGEYALQVSDASSIDGDVIVALPLATDLLPPDWNPAGLVPKALDPASRQWVPVGRVVSYDDVAQQVLFDVPFADYSVPAGSGSTALGLTLGRTVGGPASAAAGVFTLAASRAASRATVQAAATPGESRYRIDLHYMSGWVTYVPAGPHTFEVEYYPISGLSYSVPTDQQWLVRSPWATEPKVPDFVEDLQHALEVGYTGLLAIQQTTGPLFKPLSGVEEVTVNNTGSVDGNTSLFWGEIAISNSRIASYEQLEQVATHELTHLLCDQYYSGAAAAYNRWFFEATAEYFAARARGLSAPARGTYYSSPSVAHDVYLSIPLTSSNVASYYAAAHFLDWCCVRYGESVVPTAIVYGSYHPVDRNDLEHFSEALVLHGEPGGLSGAYAAYVRDLLVRPEDCGGANAIFKEGITTYAAKHHLSAAEFDDYVTHVKLSRSLPPLTSTGVFLQGRNNDDALLVMDSGGSSASSVSATTFDFQAPTNAAHEATPAVDAGLAFPYPRTLTVAGFGRLESKRQLEQLIANSSTSETAQVEIIYYLLRPPSVTLVEQGAVTWSTAKLGNMPRETLQGYHVYRDGVRLTSSPISVPMEGYPDLRFESDQIKEGDSVVVQIVDRAGNAWPRITVPPTETTTSTTEVTTTTTEQITELVASDLTGMWLGSMTFTKVYVPDFKEAMAEINQQQSQAGGGCDPAAMDQYFIEDLVGKTWPVTLDIVAGADGKGSVTVAIDYTSYIPDAANSGQQLIERVEAPLSWSGAAVEFTLYGWVIWTGTVRAAANGLVLEGDMRAESIGGMKVVIDVRADWTLTKQP